MGGTVKNVAGKIGRVGSDVFTLGTAEIARNNLSQKNVVNQALQAPGTIVTGGTSQFANPISNASSSLFATGAKGAPIYKTTLNPYGDQAQVQQLGQAAYANNAGQIAKNLGSYDTNDSQIAQYQNQDLAQRAAARDKLSQLLQQQAQQSMKMTLPGTAEDFNSGGLLNSTGYGQEVARQEANLASGISNQIAQQGLQDINVGSQYEQAGLQNQLEKADYGRTAQMENVGGLNTANQSALQRQFSVNDFGNAANTASIIGAQNAPSVGKAGTGALLGGAGSALGGAGSFAKGIGGLK